MTPNRESMTWAGAMIWLGLRTSPLRRTFDRWEIAARWVAILAMVSAIVVGPAASSAVRGQLSDAAEQQRQALHSATATLLEDTRLASTASEEPDTRLRALATWTTSDGQRREGYVSVTEAGEEGDQVPVLLDSDGSLTMTPASELEISVTATVAGLLAAGGMILLAICWLAVVRRLLQHSVQRYWDRAWMAFDETGPRPSH